MTKLSLRRHSLPVLASIAVLVSYPTSALSNIVPYGYVTPKSATINTFQSKTITFTVCHFVPKQNLVCNATSVPWTASGGHLTATMGSSTTWTNPKHIGGTYTVTATWNGKTYTCTIKAI